MLDLKQGGLRQRSASTGSSRVLMAVGVVARWLIYDLFGDYSAVPSRIVQRSAKGAGRSATLISVESIGIPRWARGEKHASGSPASLPHTHSRPPAGPLLHSSHIFPSA